jgi:hypothetical protein
MAGDRARAAEYAERVNAAADMADAGMPAAEVARNLAGRFGCSVRQARRYVERAAQSGRVVAPLAATVFTVKLPAGLAGRVRAHAREAGVTISAVVAQALEEFLERGRRNQPRR